MLERENYKFRLKIFHSARRSALHFIFGALLAALPAAAFAFTDITPNSGYYIPVSFLEEKNLVAGYENGTFQPDRPVNRAEALTMIVKVTGMKDADPGT